MDNVNKTLYIPLYGKAYVSKKGIILSAYTPARLLKSCTSFTSIKSKTSNF